MKACLIISGGEYCAVPDDMSSAISECEFVIACDKGLEYAQEMGIKVDLALGDFDSFCGSPEEIECAHCENDENGKGENGEDGGIGMKVVRLPAEKDDTDTFFAIKEALKYGYKDIVILCALGKRLDHEIANIQSALYAVKNGARVEIIGGDERLHFFSDGKLTLKKRDGFSLSVFSLTDQCEGVCERGTKYTLENATLENSFPIGVSNEWAEDEAEISVGKGVLLVVESRLR